MIIGRRSNYEQELPRPTDARTFMQQGGMRKLEHIAAAKAAQTAIRRERLLWLARLARWQAGTADGLLSYFLGQEIRRLRRALGIKPSADVVRTQTRERVGRHRQARTKA